MDRSSLIVDLQYVALVAFAVDLLVRDLDVLEAAAIRLLLVLNRDGELVLESCQVQIFRSQCG
jgi:hypothetical protein